MKKIIQHLLGAFSVLIMLCSVICLHNAETIPQAFLGIFLSFLSLLVYSYYRYRIDNKIKNI